MKVSNIGSKILYCALGVVLGLGPILGYFVGKAIEKHELNNEALVVAGLSEEPLDPNMRIWLFNFNDSSNDLNALKHKMTVSKDQIENFLLKAGFAVEELQSIETIFDKVSIKRNTEKYPRYRGNIKLILKTNKVNLLLNVQEQQFEGQISDNMTFYYSWCHSEFMCTTEVKLI